jgi:hypothetical protein
VTNDDRDNLLLYAAGALDAAEAAELRQRLTSGPPGAVGARAAAAATLALLPLALPEQAPSAAAKDRLMAALPARGFATVPSAGGPAMKITPQSADNARGWKRQGLLAIAASLVIFFVSMALLVHARREGQQQDQLAKTWQAELAETRAMLASQALQLQASKLQLEKSRNLLTMAQAESLQLVGLASPDAAASKARGRIWWDKDQGQWLITVSNLQPPAPGREYELWFITADERKIPSKVFNTNAAGEAVIMVDLPADLKDIALAAITDEPLGGLPAPTGAIHLVGKIEKQ